MRPPTPMSSRMLPQAPGAGGQILGGRWPRLCKRMALDLHRTGSLATFSGMPSSASSLLVEILPNRSTGASHALHNHDVLYQHGASLQLPN